MCSSQCSERTEHAEMIAFMGAGLFVGWVFPSRAASEAGESDRWEITAAGSSMCEFQHFSGWAESEQVTPVLLKFDLK